eukprot:4564984-Pleurochrysis_carterae.AAC.1
MRRRRSVEGVKRGGLIEWGRTRTIEEKGSRSCALGSHYEKKKCSEATFHGKEDSLTNEGESGLLR